MVEAWHVAAGIGAAITTIGAAVYLSKKGVAVQNLPIGSKGPTDYAQVFSVPTTFATPKLRIKFTNQITGNIDMMDSHIPSGRALFPTGVITGMIVNIAQIEKTNAQMFLAGTFTPDTVKIASLPIWSYASKGYINIDSSVPPPIGQRAPMNYAFIDDTRSSGWALRVIYYDQLSSMVVAMNTHNFSDTFIRAIPHLYEVRSLTDDQYHYIMQTIRSKFSI